MVLMRRQWLSLQNEENRGYPESINNVYICQESSKWVVGVHLNAQPTYFSELKAGEQWKMKLDKQKEIKEAVCFFFSFESNKKSLSVYKDNNDIIILEKSPQVTV